jgi:predicted acyltransferase
MLWAMNQETPGQFRVVSLDQFRGYTVLGMFLVNFVGHFQVMPAILKHHHTYCSYADTIMPQFFFAVGFAYRLTLLRRIAAVGRAVAYGRVVRRSLGLILLGAVIYHVDGSAGSWAELQRLGVAGFFGRAFQRNLFQTLVHIGITSLWVLPVVAAGGTARAVFALASALLHVAASYWFYYDWVMTRPGIDGGPLGFLTWTVPLLAGTLAHDLVVGDAPRSEAIAAARFAAAGRLLRWGVGLMVLGYGLACLNRVVPPLTQFEHAKVVEWKSRSAEVGGQAAAAPLAYLAAPPFTPPTAPVSVWTMSQRAGSVSYLTFGAGFSLALYAAFVLLCDLGGWQAGVFRTFGSNALAGYILHELVSEAIQPYAPKDSPLGYALAAFVLFLGVCYLLVRHLEKSGVFLKL